nr:MAG TPA: hypothetical protein [Caudoviricetes sp.]
MLSFCAYIRSLGFTPRTSAMAIRFLAVRLPASASPISTR